MNTYLKSKMLLILTVCFAVVVSNSVYALDFGLFTFDDLKEESSTIIVGQVINKKDEQEHHLYTVNALIQKKGIAVNHEMSVQVLRWADDGKLNPGEVYLLFLTGSDPYQVVGVHQGIIGINLEEGLYESRFYSSEEIDDAFPFETYQKNLFQNALASTGLTKGSLNHGSTVGFYSFLILLFLLSAGIAYIIVRKKVKTKK